MNHTFAISRYQKILVCLKIGYPESHGLSSFPIVKLPFGGILYIGIQHFQAHPNHVQLVTSSYPHDTSEKNSEKTSIVVVGYTYIYMCIYIYMWISPIPSHSNPMIMIGNSTQLVLHLMVGYIYIIPLYSDKNSQRYIKIT